jgi:hypothetical protein
MTDAGWIIGQIAGDLLGGVTRSTTFGQFLPPYQDPASVIMDVDREIAHAQYYGWALKNRSALIPREEQVRRAAATVEELRRKHHGEIVTETPTPTLGVMRRLSAQQE